MAGARHLPNGDVRNTGLGLSECTQRRAAYCLSVASKLGHLAFEFLLFFPIFLLEDQLLFLRMEPATWPPKDLPGFKVKDSSDSHGALLPAPGSCAPPSHVPLQLFGLEQLTHALTSLFFTLALSACFHASCSLLLTLPHVGLSLDGSLNFLSLLLLALSMGFLLRMTMGHHVQPGLLSSQAFPKGTRSTQHAPAS